MLCLFLIGRGSRQTELKLTKSQFIKKYNRREDLVYYEYIDPEFKSGLVPNSIIFCCLFTIKDRCKTVRFQQTHNQGFRQLLLTVSWDLRA